MECLQVPCLFFLHPFAPLFVSAPVVVTSLWLPALALCAAATVSLLVYRRIVRPARWRLDAERGVTEWINSLSSSSDIRLFVSDGTLYVQGVANLGPKDSPEKFYRPDLYTFPPESFDLIYYEDSFWDHYADTPEEMEFILWNLLAPNGLFIHAFRGKVSAVVRKPLKP